jgi:O-antigen/teichoic acid export membrane protein
MRIWLGDFDELHRSRSTTPGQAVSAFRNAVLTVLSGTALSQLVLLALMPVLSRFFQPADFGLLQAMQSFMTLLLVCSALRLEVGVLTEPQESLAEFVSVCIWLCFATSGTVAAGIAVWAVVGEPLATQLGPLIYVLPVSAFLSGLGLVISYVILRQKVFGFGAQAKVTQSLSFGAAALGAGFAFPSALTLAVADAAGRAAYCGVALSRRAVRSCLSSTWPDRHAVRRVIARRQDLVTWSLPGAIINVLGSSYTPVIMLALFTAAEAGQYAIVERAIGGPIGMIAGAAAQVFAANFAGATDRRALFRSLVLSQTRMAFIPASALLLLAPGAFPFVFGESWTLAGQYAQALTPLFVCAYIVGPVNMALTIAGHQRTQFVWDIARLIVVIAVWSITHALDMTSLQALWLYGGTMSLCQLAHLMITDRMLAGARA